MLAKIQKWGNSLALRIPKVYADEAGLGNNSPVEIQVVNGEIRIIPVHKPYYELDDLLEGMTDDNLHSEVDWGKPEGKEAW